MVVVLSTAILKCGTKMNCGLIKNSGIQFAEQENIIINSNILQIQPHVRKLNYFRFSGAILNFGVKESPDKVSMGTVGKLTLENMGIAFGILSLGGTEHKIHLGDNPPQLQRTFKKNTIATLGLSRLSC